MDRHNILNDPQDAAFYEALTTMHQKLDAAFKAQFNRSLPFADEVLDRWERAKKLGFGEGSSIYDSSYIFGEVKVGKQTWIGPFTIIDGSGGLTIGDNCTVSAGVHIYTHDNIAQTLTGHQAGIERAPVRIGNCTYIGPNAILKKGISIGECCIIGAGCFVNDSIPANSVVAGLPGKIIGTTKVEDGKLVIEYKKA